MRPPRGRQKLFDAATRLFAAQGFDATTVEQITAEAGVSKGLVYNYFRSKEELLVALLDHATSKMTAVAGTLGHEGELEEVLAAFVDDYLGFLERERQFLALQLSLMTTPALRKFVAGPQARRAGELLELVARWFRRANVRQPKSKARVLLAMLDGVALHYLVVFERYPLRAQKPHLIRAALAMCEEAA